MRAGRMEPGRSSLKLSISHSITRNATRGARAMATLITGRPLPENLQRDHRFPPRRLSAFDRNRLADRQRQVQRRQRAEAEIDLSAGVRDDAPRLRRVEIG